MLSFFLLGCLKEYNPPVSDNLKLIGSNATANVYILTLDGKDYILVTGIYKAAICPK